MKKPPTPRPPKPMPRLPLPTMRGCRALEDYKTLRAPFAGTITARNTDIGQLIKADTDSDPELFNIADTHQLRLYVPVPQNYAAVIHPAWKPQLDRARTPWASTSRHA